MKTINLRGWGVVSSVIAAFSFLLIFPSVGSAASCSFARDLQLGSVGEDVRCLQQWLNSNGYVIATTGAGAKGKETDEFKDLTKAALVRWQTANNVSPASGYFGAKTRLTLARSVPGATVTEGGTQSVTSGKQDAMLAQIARLQKEIKDRTLSAGGSQNNVSSNNIATGASVLGLMEEALDAMDEAYDAIDDGDVRASAIEDAEDGLKKAREAFFSGVREYINRNYNAARNDFRDAVEYADDATETAGGNGDEREAEDLIADVEDRIDETKDDIDQADEDGKATSKAEDLLDEAKDLLDEAQDAFDDEDYGDAIDLANDADAAVDDALKAIGKKSKSSKGGDLEDRLDELRSDLDDARDAVDSALNKNKEVGKAKSLLNKAEDDLDDAENALDDGDDADAEDYLDGAEDYIKDALDEF